MNMTTTKRYSYKRNMLYIHLHFIELHNRMYINMPNMRTRYSNNINSTVTVLSRMRNPCIFPSLIPSGTSRPITSSNET